MAQGVGPEFKHSTSKKRKTILEKIILPVLKLY
jgi:hypothetical protein